MEKYDSLTGLPTRETFFKAAEQLMRRHPDKKYDIVLSDFVNFKHFNTRYGVAAGDLLLSKVGEMLSACGPDVVCGRYGGDQFVTIVEHLSDEGIGLLQNFQLPERAKEELPVESVIVKFGVCANIDATRPISDFCDRALIAVQNVKHFYGKNVELYDELNDEKIKNQLKIEEEMENALRTGRFEVYYQPKFDIRTEEIVGAEALVRWNHPQHGIISPLGFMNVFEKTGFITNLDKYVWEKVCGSLAERKKAGQRNVPVSVNVSRVDFGVELPSNVIMTLTGRYGISHDLLHIEITESAYTEHPERVLNDLRALHDNGFTIELDDFGSGYSSLSFLGNAPIDIIKVDKSLLTQNVTDAGKNVLTFALQLAKMMNLQTIQEGVETKEQLVQLRKMGCDAIQGFLYSKPLPPEDYFRFLDTYRPAV